MGGRNAVEVRVPPCASAPPPPGGPANHDSRSGGAPPPRRLSDLSPPGPRGPAGAPATGNALCSPHLYKPFLPQFSSVAVNLACELLDTEGPRSEGKNRRMTAALGCDSS